MLSFVKFDENSGIWANRNEALSYIEKGYEVYGDNVKWEKLSKKDIEKMEEKDAGGEKVVEETHGK